jgi:D-3-phosphoglycerate dehydrogenase / 2-oxoglutarate reductase
MDRPRILTPTGASFTTAGGGYDLEMEALERLGAEIVECPATEEAFIAAAPAADAIYAKGMKFSAKMIGALSKAKIIACATVGVDYVDVTAATAKGIPVTNCPDTFIEEVADHAMMLLLAAHRRCIEQDRMVREGRWGEGRPQLLKVPRLMGSTLGFVAFGRVARLTAMRAKAFGLRMLAYDPFVDELTMSALGVVPASLDQVLAESDFVSMHAPDTAETRKMLTTKHFARMKKTAIFINTGRGPTVDEAALITALQSGQIAGAGLDVFEVEPCPADEPILTLDNVVVVPHSLCWTDECFAGNGAADVRAVLDVMRGQVPKGIVNRDVVERPGWAGKLEALKAKFGH